MIIDTSDLKFSDLKPHLSDNRLVYITNSLCNDKPMLVNDILANYLKDKTLTIFYFSLRKFICKSLNDFISGQTDEDKARIVYLHASCINKLMDEYSYDDTDNYIFIIDDAPAFLSYLQTYYEDDGMTREVKYASFKLFKYFAKLVKQIIAFESVLNKQAFDQCTDMLRNLRVCDMCDNIANGSVCDICDVHVKDIDKSLVVMNMFEKPKRNIAIVKQTYGSIVGEIFKEIKNNKLPFIVCDTENIVEKTKKLIQNNIKNKKIKFYSIVNENNKDELENSIVITSQYKSQFIDDSYLSRPIFFIVTNSRNMGSSSINYIIDRVINKTAIYLYYNKY